MHTLTPSQRGYLLQAVAIPAWWAGMLLNDSVYAAFDFPGISRIALFSFLIPDLVVLCGLSVREVIRPSPVNRVGVLAGFAYGTLWCLSASLLSGGGILSSLVMFLGTLFNLQLHVGQRIFRTTTSPNPLQHLLRTFLQSVVLWALTLLVFPLIILYALDSWPPEISPRTATPGAVLFGLCSALGIWSGSVMALHGKGTPLPVDAPQRLVTCGPYAWVRNPMAIAGLGQGFGVALIFGSPAVAGYVLTGLLVWNLIIRPQEEMFMGRTFGKAYQEYQQQVRCWIPTFRKVLPLNDPE